MHEQFFKKYMVQSLCKKSRLKLNSGTIINGSYTFDQKSLHIKAAIKSQFNYCPPIWMFILRSLSNSLNYIHECAPRLIHDYRVQSFQSMIEIINQKTILQKNLECLVKKIYKFIYGLSPPVMNDLFQIKENVYNLEKKRVRG